MTDASDRFERELASLRDRERVLAMRLTTACAFSIFTLMDVIVGRYDRVWWMALLVVVYSWLTVVGLREANRAADRCHRTVRELQ